MAAEGMLFTDYYAEASCTAGRANFITGELPIRTGLTTVGQAGSPIGMPAEAVTIAQALKSMGYATGQFGKNHLGDHNNFLPLRARLRRVLRLPLSSRRDGGPGSHELSAELKPRSDRGIWSRAGRPTKNDPTVQPRWGEIGMQTIEDAGPLYPARMETVDDEILARAIKFLDKAKKDGKPFFLWLNPTRMHVMTHLSTKYNNMRNAENGWSIQEAGMSQLDEIVGSVMKKLKDMGVDDNTIVVFTTDNGAENFTWPDGGQTPFAGGKGTVLEGGFRVPAIARWPGKIPPTGQNGILSGLDWFPTFVAAAGNPNIAAELKTGKKLGGTKYKVHLDGYNQIGPAHRQGPVGAARDILLCGKHAGRGADRRLQVPLHRPAQRLAGRHDQARLAHSRQPAPRSVRAHRSAQRRERLARVLQLVRVRVLALRVRVAGDRHVCADVPGIPAHAAWRELQPRSAEGGAGSEDGGDGEAERVIAQIIADGPARIIARGRFHLITFGCL